MTEEDMKAFLEANKAEIGAAVKKATIDRLIQQHHWQFTDQVAAAVAEFVKTEIVPEVKAELMTQKGPIIEGIIKSCATIGDKVAETMTKTAIENLTGYRGSDVFKKLFGG